MKSIKWVAAVLMAAALITTGCKKGVSTSQLESSFKGSESAAQSAVAKTVACVEAEDYAGATAELSGLASQPNLTPAQKQAIADLVEQIKKVLADQMQKTGQDATKAMGDMQKSLGK